MTSAREAAESAAGKAGVEVREIEDVPTLWAAADLLREVWRAEAHPVPPNVLRALAHAGNYVAGAFEGDSLVGASAGFLADPGAPVLHSHITGLLGRAQGLGIGFALKLHQRAWALARGIEEIRWTFDPLQRRNALFNLWRLRVDVVEYLTDFYGTMIDGINAGDESDRLLVSWALRSDRVLEAIDRTHVVEFGDGGPSQHAALGVDAGGAPVRGQLDGWLIRMPEDIDRLRAEAPDVARAWRYAMREALGGALEDGRTIEGVARPGWYVLSKAEE